MDENLLFTERELRGMWNPRQAVLDVLREKGLTEEEVNLFGPLFDEFRKQGPDEGLILPEVRKSSEWESMFYKYKGTNRTPEKIEYQSEEQYFGGLRNLDNIGRDFISLIYYYQKFSEDLSQGLNIFLRRFFRGQKSDSSSLGANNTLVYSEALFDVLLDYGINFPNNEKSVVISDQPRERHITLEETPSFLSMIRTGANLDRYIRHFSVILQDGGTGDDLRMLSPQDYKLSKKLKFFGDRNPVSTSPFSLRVAICREFGLNLNNRIDKLPSLRDISEKKKIPFSDLLSIFKDFGAISNEGSDIFSECDFLERGDISDRFLNLWTEEIDDNLKIGQN